MCATRPACPLDVCQQGGVRFGHDEVIGLDRNDLENRLDETLTLLSPAPVRQPNANPQLRHGDRRYSDIITVVDRLG